MKVLIVGWYGTETIGDRAILLGIFQILGAFPIEEIFLGSLFPFFTERTIYQDSGLIKNKLPNTKISIVDIRDRDKLKNAVKDSSSVIMGGGPLMGLNELTYILRAFKYARIYKKSTGLIGIGLEKANNSQYLKLIMKILNLSDLIIYRDQNSMLYSKDLGIKQENQFVLSDPAILPCEEFLGVSAKEDRIVINFREYDIDSDKFNYMKTIVDYAANYFDEVILYPNHTFVEGGDDRNILSNIVLSVGKSNVRVIQRPPSFSDVCTLIRASKACIGMRYHAVLMQTLLNGNNFISYI